MFKFSISTALTLLASVATVTFSSPAWSRSNLPPQDFQVEVIDGDTPRIEGSKQSIRLFGVDACEKDQTATNRSGEIIKCGDPAEAALQEWTAGKTIRCEIRNYDRYQRALAVCGTEQVSDFSAALIRQGLAVAYRYRKQAVWPEYGRIEERAKRQKAGIWAYSFDEHWIHHKKQRD
jgi:micrococcal nuclease